MCRFRRPILPASGSDCCASLSPLGAIWRLWPTPTLPLLWRKWARFWRRGARLILGLSLPPPGREPGGAFFAEILTRRRLVTVDVLRGQHVTPAAVSALVDEDLGATIPYRAAERCAFRRVGLHPCKAAMLDHCRKARLVDRDVEKGGDAAHLPRQVGAQFLEMQQHQIRQVARRPP